MTNVSNTLDQSSILRDLKQRCHLGAAWDDSRVFILHCDCSDLLLWIAFHSVGSR